MQPGKSLDLEPFRKFFFYSGINFSNRNAFFVIAAVAIRFITTQGRMKFTRPLYRALYKSKMGKQLAVTTFLQHKDFYHPIGVKMIAQDLKVGKSRELSESIRPLLAGTIAAVAVGIAISFVRRRK